MDRKHAKRPAMRAAEAHDGSTALRADASADQHRGPGGIPEHAQRGLILGELHARPFEPMTTPQRVFHFGLITSEEEAQAGRDFICNLAAARGQAPPAAQSRHHRLVLGAWTLSWEQHTEFTTYTWSTPADDERPFSDAGALDFGLGSNFIPPGQLLIALRLALIDGELSHDDLDALFERQSLAVIDAADGGARVSTDFHMDAAGFVRYLVENRGLKETRAGRLVQRVLEVETYKTLALQGGPVAREAGPIIAGFEAEQVEVTRAIAQSTSIGENRKLLTRLTDLAARLEAQSAETSYRYSASTAYESVVNARLKAMRETEHQGYVSFTRFLRRRLKPAIDTCISMDKRQRELSQKLSRTAELLSTRIQFDLEQQNRDLLQSMNRRARLQLRLQQTVEGLSIGAISYYVVGLVGYVAKGVKATGLLPKWLSPEIVMGLSVPVVILVIWAVLHHARKNWSKPGDGE